MRVTLIHQQIDYAKAQGGKLMQNFINVINDFWGVVTEFYQANDLLILFIVLNVTNVIIQTIKSLATVKCGKTVAALVNAVAYGLYTVVTIYMLCDLPLMWKAGIVALCNLIGVYIVKWAEEKMRKDKLWKVEATVHKDNTESLHTLLKDSNITHNYVEGVGQWTIFNCYCPTQADSAVVREILKEHNAKFFVSESKAL